MDVTKLMQAAIAEEWLAAVHSQKLRSTLTPLHKSQEAEVDGKGN